MVGGVTSASHRFLASLGRQQLTIVRRYFSHRQLPKSSIDESFHRTDIRIDGNAVAKLIHEHVTGTLTDAS